MFNYKFNYSKLSIILQEKEVERARKQILFKLIGPHSSPDELFRVISKLISIPTIMIELPDKVVQSYNSEENNSSKFQEDFTGLQISSNQWYSFLKTIDKINSYNFNVNTWFQICEQGKFECDDDIKNINEFNLKKVMHSQYVTNKYPIRLCITYMDILFNTIRFTGDIGIGKELTEAINYIIKLCVYLFPDTRASLLKNAIIEFRTS
jgi:hypothetical protein